MEPSSCLPVRVCVCRDFKAELGSGADFFSAGGMTGKGVKCCKCGTFQEALAENKREKDFFLSAKGVTAGSQR